MSLRLGAAVALLVAVAVARAAAAAGVPADHDAPGHVAPLFTIDTDAPPERRWAAVLAHYRPSVPAINAYFEKLTHALPSPVRSLLETVAGDLGRVGSMTDDTKRELRAFADGFGMSFGRIVALNFLYELRWFGPTTNTTTGGDVVVHPPPSACTSIVAQNAKDAAARPIHVRNLDWNLPDGVRNLTFACRFVSGASPVNARHVYTAACFPGFAGILSALRVDTASADSRYAVTIDERAIGGNPIVDAFEGLLRGGYSPTHLLRHVVATAPSYDAALAALRSTPLAAPVYFIVSGGRRGDGVVVERDHRGVHAQRSMRAPGDADDGLASAHHVLKTNYDFDKPAPVRDNRRRAAVALMRAVGGNVTMDAMLRVIRTEPVRNFHTSYEFVAVPATASWSLRVLLDADVPPPPPPAAALSYA